MTGFEIFFSAIGPTLVSKNDLLVAVIHWQCIQKGFICIGTGEEFSETQDNGSELLPNDWNQSQDTYILRYVNIKSGQKLLIKAVKVSDVFLISALIIGNNYAASHQIRADDYITDTFHTFNRAFVSGSVNDISKVIETKLINKVVNPTADRSTNTSDADTRQRQPEFEYDPLRVGPPGPRPNPYAIDPYYDPTQGGQWPPPYGGADLDPLGRRQGGMLMDPRNFPFPSGGPRNPAPGLPRGAVPPGARFDPFGPPGTGIGPFGPGRNPRQAAPDPDHLPPPGYDDMFM